VKDTRPSICGKCGKPATGFAFKGVGACSMACLDDLQGGDRAKRERLAIVNDDSIVVAHAKAGTWLKQNEVTDLGSLTLEKQREFCKTIVRAYLGDQIGW
tara:strand:+ start:899 stop:1198 length:300 start_codon:yes stop_codon:yes gene_type:complete